MPSTLISRWLTKRVEFSYEGRPWPLVITHRVLLECEELTGNDMLSAKMIDPSARFMRALLFVLLTSAGALCSLDQVGKIIGRRHTAARKTLTDAWIASMAEPERRPEGEKKNAPGPELTWLEVWASARQQLNLTDEEWLDMTPRQLKALQKIHIQELQRQELMVGMLGAAIKNFSMAPPKRPASPEDFMLHKLPATLPPELLPTGVPIGEQIVAMMSPFAGGNDPKVQMNVS